MKIFTDKKIIKKIIILLVLITLFNFISPTISRASLGEVLNEALDGVITYLSDSLGDFFMKSIGQFLRAAGDWIMEGLEWFFIGGETIKEGSSYKIKYTPGVIFSGVVPALSINFFNPMETKRIVFEPVEEYSLEIACSQSGYKSINDIEKHRAIFLESLGYFEESDEDKKRDPEDVAESIKSIETDYGVDVPSSQSLWFWSYDDNPTIGYNYYTVNGSYRGAYEYYLSTGADSVRGFYITITEKYYSYISTIPDKETIIHDFQGDVDDIYNYKENEHEKAIKAWIARIKEVATGMTEGNEEADNKWAEIKEEVEKNLNKMKASGKSYDTACFNIEALEGFRNCICEMWYVSNTGEFGIKLSRYELVSSYQKPEIVLVSSSKTLQPIVATWYKTLRAIALVGLLSVLVYIGTRILISTTGQEKAKYKKMIGNWLAAICLLFVLQYIMIFIIELSEAITDILSKNVILSDGTDSLMSNVRNRLGNGNNPALAELVIYIILIVYTILFTLQYLKRVLYMGFFTMIAPLVTLTYPIDKINDGKAQAFSIWLREYIFNAFLQPMHILLYYIFVSSASALVNSNWIYAMVAMGFLVPAEKFFRKMFGFEKAESSGQMGAAAGGAAAMNAMNSLKKVGKSSGVKNSNDSNGSAKITPRYMRGPGAVNTNADMKANLSKKTGGILTGAGVKGTAGKKGTGLTGKKVVGKKGTGKTSNNSSKSLSGRKNGDSKIVLGQKVKPAGEKGKSSLKNGAKTLAGHYINGNNAKKIGRGILRGAVKGTVGLAGAATLGTIGLAIGTATGDASKALGYGAAGAGTGFSVGSNLADKGMELEKKNREIFKEGALGTDEYNTRKSIKELTNDNNFNTTCKTLGVKNQKGREELIREFHSNGIKTSEEIRKAVKARAKLGVSQEQVIAAYKIKKDAKKYGLTTTDIRKRLINQEIKGEQLKHVMGIIDML